MIENINQEENNIALPHKTGGNSEASCNRKKRAHKYMSPKKRGRALETETYFIYTINKAATKL